MPPAEPVRPAFSLRTWLILTPYLVIALGGFDGAHTPAEWAIGISTSVEVHVALGVAFWLCSLVERLLASRPAARWTFVGLAIVGMGIGRPMLIATIQDTLGADLVPTPMPVRILMNATVLAVAVLLLHAAFESVARTLDTRRRLLAVLTSLRAQAERSEAEQRRIAAGFRREVAEPVIDALGRLVPRDLPPEQLAAELEWLAELVVRPISHRARDAGLDEAIADIDPALPPPSTSRVLLRPAQVAAAPAWAVTLVTTLLFLPPELGANGMTTGGLLLLAATAASFLGSVLIRRIPLPARPARAIALLTALYLALGLIAVWILLGPARENPLADYYLGYGAVGFVIAAVVLSLILSSTRELAEHQHRTAAALAQADRRVFHAREALVAAGERTTRRLHTGVQGDIIGTAMRLKTGAAEPDALEELLDRVAHALSEDGAAEPDEATPAIAIREAILAVLAAWSRSIRLETSLEDEALEWLGAHPGQAAVASEAIAEGLTNAVRHGGTDAARVDLRRRGDGVEVRVANRGRLVPHGGDGLGLRDLDARARRVTLEQDGEDVVLVVLV